jgi:hypothetical protein
MFAAPTIEGDGPADASRALRSQWTAIATGGSGPTSYTVFRERRKNTTCLAVRFEQFKTDVPRTGKYDLKSCYEGTGLRDTKTEPYSEMGAFLGQAGAVYVGLIPGKDWTSAPVGGTAETVQADGTRVIAYFVTAPERPGSFEIRNPSGAGVATCRATLKHLTTTCSPDYLASMET